MYPSASTRIRQQHGRAPQWQAFDTKTITAGRFEFEFAFYPPMRLRIANRALPVMHGDFHAGSDELENVIEREPSPDFAAMIIENVSRLFSMLTLELRQIAERKLEDQENAQIARELGCGLRTIERRLQLIRRIWDANP
jgi:hypothetical protein